MKLKVKKKKKKKTNEKKKKKKKGGACSDNKLGNLKEQPLAGCDDVDAGPTVASTTSRKSLQAWCLLRWGIGRHWLGLLEE